MMNHHLFLKPEDATLHHGNQGFISRRGGCGGRGKIQASGHAFAFSTLLHDRIMNQVCCRAKLRCRIPPAHGMSLSLHHKHMIAASSGDEDVS